MQALVALPALAGAGGLATLSTVLGLAGSLYTTIYQRKVAMNMAEQQEDNAKRARFASQVSAQDRDMEAAVIMDEESATRAFTGFASDSGSYERSDRRNRVLARRDALRIRQEGDLEASQYQAKAAEARAEGKALGIKGLFDVIGGAIDIRSNMISDASLASKRKSIAVNRIKV